MGIHQNSILAPQPQLIALCGFHDARARERFLPSRPPPNRFRPGVAIENSTPNFDHTTLSVSVGEFRPSFRRSRIPPGNLCTDYTVALKSLLNGFGHRLELHHFEGLQLLLKWKC